MASEAASLGLKVNWQKTKVQRAIDHHSQGHSRQGQEVVVFDEFVYLGSLIHSSTQALPPP